MSTCEFKMNSGPSDTSEPDVKPYLFTSFNGAPISFHIQLALPKENLLEDTDPVFRDKWYYGSLIMSGGGRYIADYRNMTHRTVLLADDENNCAVFERPCFRIQYVMDCITKGKLLDLKQYIHPNCTRGGGYRNFFDIIWMQNGTFVEGGEGPLNGQNGQSDCEQLSMEVQSFDSDSSDSFHEESNISTIKKKSQSKEVTSSSRTSRVQRPQAGDRSNVTVGASKRPRKIRKKIVRNGSYSEEEEVKMLKFIVRQGKLTSLRGNILWRLMEEKKICPPRTSQSLKNHFLKHMVGRLEEFKFLTETQITLMETAHQIQNKKKRNNNYIPNPYYARRHSSV